MKTDTAQKILDYIAKQGQATPKELRDFLMISAQALFRQLKQLLAKNKIEKIGLPPKVFYLISEISEHQHDDNSLSGELKALIDENFLLITPDGKILQGWEGFRYWCEKRDLVLVKSAQEYRDILKRYAHFKKNGVVDGILKMKSTFKKVYLDKLFYLDFYSIERFGKTKLGQLLLYAKQSQNKQLIREVSRTIEPKIKWLIDKYDIDGVAFIPPTVRREVQFMKELQKNLNLSIKNFNLIKIKTGISVPQKTLAKLEDRIENAKKTIMLDEKLIFENILLIDDAVGSGATLNETARKIRLRKICNGKIIGLAITGSFKGFDVISEV